MADEATIQSVFDGREIKNKVTREIALLKDLIVSARNQLNHNWFTHIQHTGSGLHYGLKPVPTALNIIHQVLYNRCGPRRQTLLGAIVSIIGLMLSLVKIYSLLGYL